MSKKGRLFSFSVSKTMGLSQTLLFTGSILMSIILTFLQHFKPSPKSFLVQPGASYQHVGTTRVIDFLQSSLFISVPLTSTDTAASPITALLSLTRGHFDLSTICIWICGHECAPPTTEAHPLSPHINMVMNWPPGVFLTVG